VRSRVGFAAVVVAVATFVGLAACGERTITITVPDGIGPAPANTAAAVATPALLAPQYVCIAMHLAASGQWQQAEMHWITNETKTSDFAGTMAFLQLGEDAGAIALDQYANKPIADDVATYNADLAGDGGYTAGC
jgi:hypothetical protein